YLPFVITFNFNEIFANRYVVVGVGYLMLSIYTTYLILKFWNIKKIKIYSYYLVWVVSALFTIVFTAHLLHRVVKIEKFLSNEIIKKSSILTHKLKEIAILNEGCSLKELRNKSTTPDNFCPKKDRHFLLVRKTNFENQGAFSTSKLRLFFISEKFNSYRYLLKAPILVKHKHILYNHYFFLDSKENKTNIVSTSCTHIKNFSTRRNNIKIKEKTYTSCKLFCLLQFTENYSKIKTFLEQKKIRDKLLKIDYYVFKLINSNLKCKFLDFYMSVQSYCDSKKFNLSFIVILVISITILWNNKKQHFLPVLILLVSTLTVSATVIYFLKHYFERVRPLVALGSANVNVLSEKLHENSFPSGHTQLAFTACTFMFIVVRKYLILYILLVCEVAFERIYAGSHFPSDVMAGALLGIFFAYTILFLSKKI
ncbi:MAG: phosphatase PAP2 family protein, partial [Endomicrobium sp.]|nr:phosphatase PAP2 family protein [Endomicrobium sp.]